MDADAIRQIADEELEAALTRFWARVGDRADVNEHFAAAVAEWLRNWVVSYLLPDTPVDPEREGLPRPDRARPP